MDTWSLCAYWGNRRESAEDCGERLARCIAGLGAADPSLSAWYRKGRSRVSASTPIAVDAASLTALFARGRNRTDLGHEVIEELGYSASMWNGAQDPASLSVAAGITAPALVNALVLDLPKPSRGMHFYETGVARSIVRAVVESWDPEWATFITANLRHAQDAPARVPQLGWFTYLRGAAPAERLATLSEPLGSGVLIRAADKFSDVDLATLLRIRKQLKRAKLLRPIP